MVIVVDEFATLVSELPDFVDGVVDVAQQGRSLGIHLVLATQRPAGAINDNVRANTNLRIALRMNDRADSQDVLGTDDAANLTRAQVGRAFVRTGHGELSEVQVAFAGARRHAAGAAAAGITVVPLSLSRASAAGAGTAPAAPAAPPAGGASAGPTDLELVVAACREAAAALGLPSPQSPWLPALPAVVALDVLPPAPAGRATLGLSDYPVERRQEPWLWDLEATGSLLVYGGPGSGKTTLLRTLAAGLARTHDPSALHLYVLDYATRGLGALEALPHCGGVIPGDDLERTERLLRGLRRTIAERARLLADAGAVTLSAYNAAAGARGEPPLPRIVVLVDGFGNLRAALETIDFGALLDALPSLAGDARAVGVHLALTASQRTEVPLALAGAVPARVALRLAQEDDFGLLGLQPARYRGLRLGPGRGFAPDDSELQVAVAGGDAGEEQLAAIARLASSWADWTGPVAPPLRSLPDTCRRADLPAAPPGRTMLGVGGDDVVPIDVAVAPRLILGRKGTGVSTALATLAAGAVESGTRVVVLALAPCAAGAVPGVEAVTGVDAVGGWVNDATDGGGACLVVADDADELEATYEVSEWLEQAARQRLPGVTLVAGMAAGAVDRGSALAAAFIPGGRFLLLEPAGDVADALGVRLPRRPGGGPFPPGRALLVDEGLQIPLQIAE